MIKIDEEKKEIYFIPEQTEKEHPPERSFPLLSGYVCPFCNKILAAYFQGEMSTAEIEYYRQEKQRYIFGSVGGGHYVKVESHEGFYDDPNKCSWEVYSKRGIAENLRLFAEQHEIPLILVKQLSEKISLISGFCVVQDVCGRDREMLLFSEEKLLEKIREKEGFNSYWFVKHNLGKYLMDLVKQKQKGESYDGSIIAFRRER